MTGPATPMGLLFAVQLIVIGSICESGESDPSTILGSSCMHSATCVAFDELSPETTLPQLLPPRERFQMSMVNSPNTSDLIRTLTVSPGETCINHILFSFADGSPFFITSHTKKYSGSPRLQLL